MPIVADSTVLAGLRAGEQRDVPVIGFKIGLQGLTDYDPAVSSGPQLGPLPGVIVGRVEPNGPAAKAGLLDAALSQGFNDVQLAADVIVSVDGERTPTAEALTSVLRRRQVGQTVAVQVQRGSSVVTVDLELGGKRAVFGS